MRRRRGGSPRRMPGPAWLVRPAFGRAFCAQQDQSYTAIHCAVLFFPASLFREGAGPNGLSHRASAAHSPGPGQGMLPLFLATSGAMFMHWPRLSQRA